MDFTIPNKIPSHQFGSETYKFKPRKIEQKTKLQVFKRSLSQLVLFLGFCLLFPSFLFAQKTTTNLKEEAQIQTFLKVTEQIRCICLPSLPIQSCSFNMCAASSYLKTFIENRIKDGMKEEEIVSKMENGFGTSVLQDPIVVMFQESGNQGMVDSIVYGFGPKILAQPDGTWINFTLFAIGVLGLFGIYKYGTKKKKDQAEAKTKLTSGDLKSTTEQIKNKIRKFEEES
ncbi:cytochrome C biogenesis protein [Leptospira bourretii]|uniref:Cytochrome c-type biogenesis protein n=1 Tax=Leptospira bourretii TaxID=2484962 RepID=A0A4R9IR34_9LEPT|nr:cytochrome c-type biogenesis protein CcmH [Leptospira bourretii]TGK85567.1 cytochrome C biogenesis protein [Leptospira bourretii]TGK94464.1 cytochrome C biogenesis protein [Leptospira bourretii]TGL24821.1 cytochrome C biogenesis protein [Leptospira bourretii]TGL33220.1 cytochrome C biogenesis protein [Leptospira bourretii]